MHRSGDLAHRPRRRIRKRIVAAVVLSVGLHILIFSELPTIPEPRPYMSLTATLERDLSQGEDNEDSTGTSDMLETPPEPETPPQPEPPAKAQKASTPETSSPPPAPAEPQRPAVPPPVTSTSPDARDIQTTPIPSQPQQQKEPSPAVKDEVKEVIAAPKKELAGDTEVFGTPEEAEYHKILTAHLRAFTPPAPPQATGRIRLQVKIQYGSIITSVEVIDSTGNAALEHWARTAVLGMSPVPKIPPEVSQPYYFRPTLGVE